MRMPKTLSQNLRLGLPLQGIFGHAIKAAEIAAVSYRNAQIADGASVTDFEQRLERRYYHNFWVCALSPTFVNEYSINDNLQSQFPINSHNCRNTLIEGGAFV